MLSAFVVYLALLSTTHLSASAAVDPPPFAIAHLGPGPLAPANVKSHAALNPETAVSATSYLPLRLSIVARHLDEGNASPVSLSEQSGQGIA
jgi:hypothetical protein